MSSDYTRHIEHTVSPGPGHPATAWCGASMYRADWHFLDVDHAVRNGQQHGRLVACKACTDAVIKALRNGQERDAP